MANSQIEIFTDGACSGNPGPGGWAYEINLPGVAEPITDSGGAPVTTNNAMELAAFGEALRALIRLSIEPGPALVQLDSEYVVKGVNEWMEGWKSRGWRTAGRKPVANREIWERIDTLLNELRARGFTLSIEWVRGHDGHEGNERVDLMAVEARDHAMLAQVEAAQIEAAPLEAVPGAPLAPAPHANEGWRPNPAQVELASTMIEMIQTGHLNAEGLILEFRRMARCFDLERL